MCLICGYKYHAQIGSRSPWSWALEYLFNPIYFLSWVVPCHQNWNIFLIKLGIASSNSRIEWQDQHIKSSHRHLATAICLLGSTIHPGSQAASRPGRPPACRSESRAIWRSVWSRASRESLVTGISSTLNDPFRMCGAPLQVQVVARPKVSASDLAISSREGGVLESTGHAVDTLFPH